MKSKKRSKIHKFVSKSKHCSEKTLTVRGAQGWEEVSNNIHWQIPRKLKIKAQKTEFHHKSPLSTWTKQKRRLKVVVWLIKWIDNIITSFLVNYNLSWSSSFPSLQFIKKLFFLLCFHFRLMKQHICVWWSRSRDSRGNNIQFVRASQNKRKTARRNHTAIDRIASNTLISKFN